MTNTLSTPDLPQPAPDIKEGGGIDMAAKRQQFVDSMVQAGVISEAFSKSGILEQFSADEGKGRDALPHILVGDEYGGAHHLGTIARLDDGKKRRVASTLYNPANPKKRRAYYRAAQKVKDNGVFEARIVETAGDDSEVLHKSSGSMFFPTEWSTEEVLEAIVEASQTEGEHNPDSKAYTHKATIKGVPIIVNTDDFTHKIVAAHPGRK